MYGILNTEEMNNLLTSQVVGRIAYIKENRPYIVPVTYAYDGKFIYGQTNEGSKLNAMRLNNNICFEAERMITMNNWQSVIIEGQFEEMKVPSSTKARELLFGKVYTLNTCSTIHPHEHNVDVELDDSNRVKQIMFRIRIRKMTGRFDKS